MKKVTGEELVNGWLKYHGTTLAQVKLDHPEWMVEPEKHTWDFYEAYPVTLDQHDEWERWAKGLTKKVTGVRGKRFDRAWAWLHLNVAPIIKKD